MKKIIAGAVLAGLLTVANQQASAATTDFGMLGMSFAASFQENVDEVELDTATWFTRAEIRAAYEDPTGKHDFHVPGNIAIAHHLIKDWAFQETKDHTAV